MRDDIFNVTSSLCEDEDDLDFVEDKEVECYNYCNGFCTVCRLRCPFNDNEN